MDNIKQYVQENKERFLDELIELLKIPSVSADTAYSKDVIKTAEAVKISLEKAGCKEIVQNDSKQAPGLDIHEMGGVRMGKDPKTSLLNNWNQLHHCKNVFVMGRGKTVLR